MSSARRRRRAVLAFLISLFAVVAAAPTPDGHVDAATGGQPNCATGFDGPHCLGLGRRATISGPGSERKMTDYWIVTVAHSRDPDPADTALIESLDGEWINGMCVQDNSFHPGGVITELMTLAERYPSSPHLAHEPTLAVARFFLDPYAATGRNDHVATVGGESLSLRDWYSGMWAYGHWVAQDRRAGVGGPTIGDFTTAPASSGARAGAAAIHRLGERYALPWASTTTIERSDDGVGAITTTVTSASGHPVPGVSVGWDPAAAQGVVLSGAASVVTDADGRARWAFTTDRSQHTIAAGSVATVPRGTVTVFVGSGQDIAGWTERDLTTISSAASVEVAGTFQIEKQLSDAALAAGRDMSGFEFQVTEVATGDDRRVYVTDAAGRTPPIDAVFGGYRIDEVGRPAWAKRLDGPGPITFDFDPTDGDGAVVEYVNVVPAASVESDARDPLDGDQTLPWFGGNAVVTLTYDVPIIGDAYVGSVVGIDPATGEPVHGVGGEATFTAPDGTGTVDIEVAIPPRAGPGGPSSIVFFDALRRADGTVIATHEQLDDARQTLTIAAPPVAEVHLRTTVSNDGDTWVNAQDDVANHHQPAPAPADPRDGSYDDQAADPGDGLPVYAPGDTVRFRYEVWLDDQSTGVVAWPTIDPEPDEDVDPDADVESDALTADDDRSYPVLTDDAGTPDHPDDDHHPRYVDGDDGDLLLEPGETWVFDATEPLTAVAGQRHVNDARLEPGVVMAVDQSGEPTVPGSEIAAPLTSARNDPAGFAVPAIATSFELADHDRLEPWPDDGVDAIDRVLVTNLTPNTDYSAELAVMVRGDDGRCTETDIGAVGVGVSDENGALLVDVGPVRLNPEAGETFVAFQRVVEADSGLTVAVHADCDAAEQTLLRVDPVPEPPATTVPTTSVPPTPVDDPPPATPPQPEPPRPLPSTGSASLILVALLLGGALLVAAGLEVLGVSDRVAATDDSNDVVAS